MGPQWDRATGHPRREATGARVVGHHRCVHRRIYQSRALRHCGKSTEHWVKARPGEILNYRSHYNANLNKCFVLATLSPSISNNFYSSFDILYDVNENKEYGHHTVRIDNKGTENDQCFIKGKYYGGRTEAQVKQKWNEFVKEMMAE